MKKRDYRQVNANLQIQLSGVRSQLEYRSNELIAAAAVGKLADERFHIIQHLEAKIKQLETAGPNALQRRISYLEDRNKTLVDSNQQLMEKNIVAKGPFMQPCSRPEPPVDEKMTSPAKLKTQWPEDRTLQDKIDRINRLERGFYRPFDIFIRDEKIVKLEVEVNKLKGQITEMVEERNQALNNNIEQRHRINREVATIGVYVSNIENLDYEYFYFIMDNILPK